MLLRYFPADLDYSDPLVHTVLLADRVRVEAYRSAVSQNVTSGCRVVELGSGSGIFGRYAAELGAHVCLVEKEHRPAQASRLLDSLLMSGNTIKTVEDKIESLVLPKSDVVIHELLGPRLLDEGMARILSDFAKNNTWYTDPSTQVLPSATSLWCRLVSVQPSPRSTPIIAWNEIGKEVAIPDRQRDHSSQLIWATDPNDFIPRSDWRFITKFNSKQPDCWASNFDINLEAASGANALLWGFQAQFPGTKDLDVRLGTGPRTSWGGVLETLATPSDLPFGSYRVSGKLPTSSDDSSTETTSWIHSVAYLGPACRQVC